jgi:uncharacterized protein YndB with AHSA1/START domain
MDVGARHRLSSNPGEMPFTAILELRPDGPNACHYRALALHQNADDRNQHDQMGFVDGWGMVVDQMVEHIQANQ